MEMVHAFPDSQDFNALRFDARQPITPFFADDTGMDAPTQPEHSKFSVLPPPGAV